MPQSRPPYPAAFRTEAVELLRTSRQSIPALARDLGVSDQTLRNGQRQPHRNRVGLAIGDGLKFGCGFALAVGAAVGVALVLGLLLLLLATQVGADPLQLFEGHH